MSLHFYRRSYNVGVLISRGKLINIVENHCNSGYITYTRNICNLMSRRNEQNERFFSPKMRILNTDETQVLSNSIKSVTVSETGFTKALYEFYIFDK